MNLNEELAQFGQQMSENAPKEVLEIIAAEIEKLGTSGIFENALKVGDTAPDFDLNDSDRNSVSLDSLLQSGSVVISFNRGNWCPFCNIEFKHLQQSVDAIKNAGANLLVISPQLPAKSVALKEEYGYDFPILFDKDNLTAKSFGIAFTLSEPLRPIHKAFEMDIPGHNGDESYELPLASTFVIDKNKQIVYSYVNVNWMERAAPEEYVAALNEIKV